MVIEVHVKDSEPVEKAIKKFKKKVEKARVLHEYKERQSFVKPSVKRRGVVLRAAFRQKMKDAGE